MACTKQKLRIQPSISWIEAFLEDAIEMVHDIDIEDGSPLIAAESLPSPCSIQLNCMFLVTGWAGIVGKIFQHRNLFRAVLEARGLEQSNQY